MADRTVFIPHHPDVMQRSHDFRSSKLLLLPISTPYLLLVSTSLIFPGLRICLYSPPPKLWTRCATSGLGKPLKLISSCSDLRGTARLSPFPPKSSLPWQFHFPVHPPPTKPWRYCTKEGSPQVGYGFLEGQTRW